MDSITILIRDEIKRQYKSVKHFSEVSGIPYSTLANALTKGINGTAYGTVMKICQILNLKQVYSSDLTIFNSQFQEICNMLEKIDNQGVHTVKTVLSIEYNRCMASEEKAKSFNGLLFASEKYNTKIGEVKTDE